MQDDDIRFLKIILTAVFALVFGIILTHVGCTEHQGRLMQKCIDGGTSPRDCCELYNHIDGQNRCPRISP